MGRPSDYTEEIADELCYQISIGKSLIRICERADMPSDRAVYRWLEANECFRQKYARARERQADFHADEIIELADTCRMGKKMKETKDGVFIEEGDMVERSKLQIEARKWLSGKQAPKKYGDKLDLTTLGDKLKVIPPVLEIRAVD